MKKFLFLLGFLLISYFTVSAQIIHVPADQPTIQAGIDAAQNGDMVLVDDGTYYENINYKGKAITVASHFIIDGDTNHISNTIINGSQPSNPDSGSTVYFVSGEDTNSVLCGFTITGGTGTVSFVGAPRLGRVGGGIFITDVGAKISHNYIYNNTIADSFAVIGGGLAAGSPTSNSFVIIENNIFNSNSCLRSVFASEGGGMFIATKSRVCNNIFSNNIASSDSGEAFGGGFAAAFNLDSVLIYNNSIINNKVESLYGIDATDFSLGGGFMIWNDMTANFKMYGNFIAYNEVSGSISLEGAGGCFQRVDGDVIFANNQVYGNYYSGSVYCHGTGMGISNNTVLSIINNTITGNEASPYGGALSTWNTISTVAMNNIFWGNSVGGSMPEIYVTAGNSPDVVYCDVEGGWTGLGNIDEDPLFIIGDTLSHLSDLSPCIGAGKDSLEINAVWYYAPPFDFDGDPRPNPSGSNPDMGALESPLPNPVGIENDISLIPKEYSLVQNYPNPFNPSTKIKYSIPKLSFVTLKVFDILGNEIATLVNEKKPAGTYELTWNAANIPSGVYFYQLLVSALQSKDGKAGEFVQTKKMLLMK